MKTCLFSTSKTALHSALRLRCTATSLLLTSKGAHGMLCDVPLGEHVHVVGCICVVLLWALSCALVLVAAV